MMCARGRLTVRIGRLASAAPDRPRHAPTAGQICLNRRCVSLRKFGLVVTVIASVARGRERLPDDVDPPDAVYDRHG